MTHILVNILHLFHVEHYKINATFAQDCKYGANLQGNEVCRVSLDTFGKCAPDYGYGFGIGQPCIFIKLNRVGNLISIYEN